MRMKKAHILLLALLAASLVGGLAWRFHFGLLEVRVAKVKSGPAINAVPGSVTVQAEYAIQLKSESRGRVLESGLELDKKVREGEVLILIDSTDLRIEIEKIESEYEAAKKGYAAGSEIALQLAGAKEALVQAERQRNAGQISEAELLRQKRAVQALEQKLAQEEIDRSLKLANFENALKARRRQLEKMTVMAPFDGIVTHIYARKGDLIDPGAPMARIIAIGRLVEARLSEENIAGVKVGQKAWVTLLPYGMQQYPAEVVKKMSSADPETQRYPVHLKVDIDPAKLLPGITGEVSIILAERDSKTNVPRPSVFGDFVYVVKGAVVEKRKVRRGFESMTAVEILEGLQPDEQVVVAEQDKIEEGDRVKPVMVDDPRWR